MVSRSQYTAKERLERTKESKGDRRRKIGESEKPDEGGSTENPTHLSPISIDPNGNLKLVVGEERLVFCVDANALRRSSEVFNAMLFGGFKEAVQNTDWTVELPEDDPWAMHILLDAIHANFEEVPKEMDISGLYRITVLTNKYDMTHCLRPWAHTWTSETNNSFLHEGYQYDCNESDMKRIWVLYELGIYSPIEDLLLGIALDASVTSDGDIQIQRHSSVKHIKLKDFDVLIDSNVFGQSQDA